MSAPVQVSFRKPASGSGPARGGASGGLPPRLPRVPARKTGRSGASRAGLWRAEDLAHYGALLLAVLIAASAYGWAAVPETGGAPAAGSAGEAPSAAPSVAPSGTGCTETDPTGGRCLTPTTAHGLAEIQRVHGPVLDGVHCQDEHAWNPRSDHPKGRACDITFGRLGRFPAGEDLDDGWRVAQWLRDNAGALDVTYVIWQGRIWTAGKPDRDGWGRAYTGGGVYDPNEPTGGHYDHVHVSFAR